jgi:hypothetical protein
MAVGTIETDDEIEITWHIHHATYHARNQYVYHYPILLPCQSDPTSLGQ